jgi:hypothetical protein
MADMYNSDILKPKNISPERIESMHSPSRFMNAQGKYDPSCFNPFYMKKLDLDTEITSELAGA